MSDVDEPTSSPPQQPPEIGADSSYPPIPLAIVLPVISPHPCPYLPDRTAVLRAGWARQIPAELYHRFMDAGFRRSGTTIYRPACPTCRACRPIRIPVAGFRPGKSQRRCGRANADLTVSVATPVPTDEKFAVYERYQMDRHGREKQDGWASFVEFLYSSPVPSVEFTYRDGSGRLLAVGICDVCPKALSSVYFYFDPDDSSRGLGTFGVIREIEFAAVAGIEHYYLGYFVEGCGAMNYKSRFRPCEILAPDGRWLNSPW